MFIFLFVLVLASAGVAATSGGGGGGGGGGAATASVVTPAPTPANNYSISSAEADVYRTTEYNAQYGLEKIHAAEAYASLAKNGKSVAGDGVVVGVTDTGVLLSHQEISANLASPNSSNTGTHVAGDHGTHVASTIAGVKSDVEMHGVAFNAKIYSADVIPDSEPGTNYNSSIDYGISDSISRASAKVINMSWAFVDDQLTIGGATYELIYSGISSEFTDAKNGNSGRGVLLAAATGNDGYTDYVDAPALFSQDSRLSGIMIAVGAVDSGGDIATFSNRCKQAKNYCLVAPGTAIYAATTGSDSEYSSFKGTSMATPHVSGAAAVIRGAWPHLTAAQTVQILLTTATDLGTAGVDDVYGHGMLNLYAAVQAQGQNTLGYGTSALSLQGYDVKSSSLVTNPIFGDAFALNVAPVLDSAIFYDNYGRDYKAFLGGKISEQKSSNVPTLESLIFNNFDSKTLPLFFGEGLKNELKFSFSNYKNAGGIGSRNFLSASAANSSGATNSPNFTGLKFVTLDSSKDPQLLSNNNFSFVRNSSDISPDLKLGFAFNTDAISDSNQNNFGNFGFIFQNNFAANPYQSFLSSSSTSNSELTSGRKFNQFFADQNFLNKKLGLKFSYQSSYQSSNSSQVRSGLGRGKENEIFDLGLALNPERGGNFLLSFGSLSEFNNNLLNSKSLGAFESAGDVKTSYFKLSSSQSLMKNLFLLTSISEGRSKINGNQQGIFRDFSDVRSQSSSVALVRDNFLKGKVGFVYSQPMRVYSGKARIDIPTARDIDGNLTRYQADASLVPHGREQDFEIFFSKNLAPDSQIKFNLVAQKESGNVRNAPTSYLGFVQLKKDW